MAHSLKLAHSREKSRFLSFVSDSSDHASKVAFPSLFLLSYLVIPEFSECLLCAKHHAGLWECDRDQVRQTCSSCPHGACSLGGRVWTKLRVTVGWNVTLSTGEGWVGAGGDGV